MRNVITLLKLQNFQVLMNYSRRSPVGEYKITDPSTGRGQSDFPVFPASSRVGGTRASENHRRQMTAGSYGRNVVPAGRNDQPLVIPETYVLGRVSVK